MAKKINHRGRGLRSSAGGRAHRELLFSLCPLCAVCFPNLIPEDNKKSPGMDRWDLRA